MTESEFEALAARVATFGYSLSRSANGYQLKRYGVAIGFKTSAGLQKYFRRIEQRAQFDGTELDWIELLLAAFNGKTALKAPSKDAHRFVES